MKGNLLRNHSSIHQPYSLVFLDGYLRQCRKYILVMIASFVLCLFSASLQAQNHNKNSDDDFGSDTIKAEDNADTTGYYFNWKEKPTDPYTKQKIGITFSSDSTEQQLKNDDDFWYVKSIEEFKKNANRIRYDKRYRDSLRKEGLLSDEQTFTQEQNGDAWYVQPWFINAIWIVIITVFIATVFFFLSSNKINLFTKKAAQGNNNVELEEKNLFAIHYDELLNTYQEQKNYRLAVRILYLQLLKILAEKQIINYQPNLTNTHYLQQLHQSFLYGDFVKVTHHYEYAWYGEFTITENIYQTIKSDFMKIKNEILQS